MRSEVNASTGQFPFPYTEQSPGDSTEQRIRVAVSDVDPTLNPGALYWLEGQYVAADDAAAENGLNNASYRQTFVTAGTFSLSFNSGIPTVRQQPAIFAWKAQDPAVELIDVDVPGSAPLQRYHVARKITDLGGGSFHYEYAVHNLNSDRSANGFTVAFPGATTITNAGFHDIDHHSGEPYATTDWTPGIDSSSIAWGTDSFATDANANALRWATMFTFWFDANRGPADIEHVLALFKPGSPVEVVFEINEIFTDGFESGDTSAWSASVP
jgi:hypothetical protein